MTKSRALHSPVNEMAHVGAPQDGVPAARGRWLGFEQAAIVEFVARFALGFAFIWLGVMSGAGFVGLLHRIDLAQPSLATVAEALSKLAITSFLLLAGSFVVIRLRPVAKSSGLRPRIAALIGSFLQIALVSLPHHDQSIAVKLISSALILGGNAFAVYVVAWLGRSFSIMPEARRLVTTGPYAVVRHPLYFGEFISSMGVLMQFYSPYGVLISGTQLAFQIARMHYEEGVLRATFAEYAAYSRRTWRFIPGLY